MSALIEQLHDIEGLDPISVWPLAIGWFVVIACGTVLLASVLWLLIRSLRYVRSWQRDTLKTLDRLEKNLSPATAKETVAFLSEYLRRIAVRRFPRKECAGLAGDAWLQWLKAHDPKEFAWTEKGKLLLDIPYSPAHRELALPEIKEILQAVKCWVC